MAAAFFWLAIKRSKRLAVGPWNYRPVTTCCKEWTVFTRLVHMQNSVYYFQDPETLPRLAQAVRTLRIDSW